MVRGIFATAQFALPPEIDAETLRASYRKRYVGKQVAVLDGESPRTATVAGSNSAEISVHVENQRVAVLCAIDNLGKGMAGQAIQNMNIALGLSETAGLGMAGVFP